MPRLRHIVPGLSPQGPKFSRFVVCVRFVVDKVVLGEVFLKVIQVSAVSNIPPVLCTFSFVYHWCCVHVCVCMREHMRMCACLCMHKGGGERERERARAKETSWNTWFCPPVEFSTYCFSSDIYSLSAINVATHFNNIFNCIVLAIFYCNKKDTLFSSHIFNHAFVFFELNCHI
jgi:hypothetical protein